MTDSIKSKDKHLRQNEEYWNDQILLKHKSRLSSAAYCRKHGIVCSKFYYWENKLNAAKTEFPQLMPVKLNVSEPLPNQIETKCTLTFTGGHVLKVHDHSILPVLISLLK